MIDKNQLKARVFELASNDNTELEEIFRATCNEFNLNAEVIASALTCECPYALIGFVAACTDVEEN